LVPRVFIYDDGEFNEISMKIGTWGVLDTGIVKGCQILIRSLIAQRTQAEELGDGLTLK